MKPRILGDIDVPSQTHDGHGAEAKEKVSPRREREKEKAAPSASDVRLR